MNTLNCPICKSDKVKKSTSSSREGEMLELIKCLNCGHTAQTPEQYKDIYTTGEFTQQARDNQKYPSSDKIKSLDKKALLRLRYYEKIFAGADNILEVGSSIGSFVHVLKLSGKEASGLEPDEAYAGFSDEQYGFSQHNKMLEDFAPDKSYGGVCSFHVLEHVQDPHVFIKKCHELLEKDGKILFEFPSLELHSYGSMKKTLWKPHVHYFTVASCYYLFSQYFEVLKVGYYGSAIFIYGKKSDHSTFSQSKFSSLKTRARINYLIAKLFPAIPVKLKTEVSAKQLLLQSTIFQQDKIKLLKKLFKLGFFTFKNLAYLKRERKGGKIKSTHLSYYSGWENAGDTVLSKCVRDTFNNASEGISWKLRKVTDPVDAQLIQEINQSNYLLLGGGGVLLPDSNPNKLSGWQWAADKKSIDLINVPMIIFAIGYNYFHGQKPNDLFIDNLKHLVKRADFFGLRNYGSIREVSKLVGPELEGKLIYQPCPTTIIRQLYPQLPKKVTTKNIGVNIAYDRYKNRFGKDIYVILDQIAISLKKLQERGYKIYNICHLENDGKFELTLDKHGVQYTSVNHQYELPWATYELYNKMELVMGMRGHAQMIPFGLNCKIISLGSHNKLKWFLEDIDALDWFVDLKESPQQVSQLILDKFDLIMENKAEVEQKIAEKQNQLFAITQANVQRIQSILQ